MKLSSCLLSASRGLALATALITLSIGALAAPLITLEGEAFDARQPEQSEVRLSVLGWSAPDKLAAIEAEYQRYTTTLEHASFETFLNQQETQGYLFTKAATGHTIKYAWQDGGKEPTRMLLLVVPALKARTPNMWHTPNNAPAPFSLLEIRLDGDEAVMKSSLDSAIASNAEGRLQLQDYAAAEEFARLRDATPYYLKESG
jgi:hypothetical protein